MNSLHESLFRFPAEHPLFADHFPGAPVVPGSLLLRAFMEEAHRTWPEASITAVRSFRFRHFVTPGEHPVRMQRTPEGIRCTLLNAQGAQLVTGTLVLATSLRSEEPATDSGEHS